MSHDEESELDDNLYQQLFRRRAALGFADGELHDSGVV